MGAVASLMPAGWLGKDPIDVVIIWILRILLPFLLLWVSFGPKLSFPWQTRNRVDRLTMLRHREIILQECGSEKTPLSMANLMLVDETTAPALFVKPDQPEPRRDRDRDRDRGGGRTGKGRGRDRGEQRRGPESVAELSSAALEEKRREEMLARERAAKEAAAEEARRNVESVVNFTAFRRSRTENQRVFLLEDDQRPPPPCKRPAEDPTSLVSAERANNEAQRVLNGALQLSVRGVAAVAQDVYDELKSHQGVTVFPSTFEAMIQLCVQAYDLPAASEFLMRMEVAGQIPSNELIDRVMQLYLEQRQDESKEKRRLEEEQAANESRASLPAFSVPDEFSTDARAKTQDGGTALRANAAVFVPRFGSTDVGNAEVEKLLRRHQNPIFANGASFQQGDNGPWATSGGSPQEVTSDEKADDQTPPAAGFTFSAEAPVFMPSGGESWVAPAMDDEKESCD